MYLYKVFESLQRTTVVLMIGSGSYEVHMYCTYEVYTCTWNTTRTTRMYLYEVNAHMHLYIVYFDSDSLDSRD